MTPPLSSNSYVIDVCSECGERVLAAGYACSKLHTAGTKVIEVAPVAHQGDCQMCGAVAGDPCDCFDPQESR